MTPEQATAFAARIADAIPEWTGGPDFLFHLQQDHRERVASDLAGLRDHARVHQPDPRADLWCNDCRRYAEGLRRTGALYGVTP